MAKEKANCLALSAGAIPPFRTKGEWAGSILARKRRRKKPSISAITLEDGTITNNEKKIEESLGGFWGV